MTKRSYTKSRAINPVTLLSMVHHTPEPVCTTTVFEYYDLDPGFNLAAMLGNIEEDGLIKGSKLTHAEKTKASIHNAAKKKYTLTAAGKQELRNSK